MFSEERIISPTKTQIVLESFEIPPKEDQDLLRQRLTKLHAAAAAAVATLEADQGQDPFLENLSRSLGHSAETMKRMLEIATRRANEGETIRQMARLELAHRYWKMYTYTLDQQSAPPDMIPTENRRICPECRLYRPETGPPDDPCWTCWQVEIHTVTRR